MVTKKYPVTIKHDKLSGMHTSDYPPDTPAPMIGIGSDLNPLADSFYLTKYATPTKTAQILVTNCDPLYSHPSILPSNYHKGPG